LRHAIDTAYAIGDGDHLITVSPEIAAKDTIKLASALGIKRTLTIEGNGVTISGEGKYRIMRIAVINDDTCRNITISRVHFTNGNPSSSVNGGAIISGGDNGATGKFTTLNLHSCIFSDNRVLSNNTKGGAIYNNKGKLNVLGCTFVRDSALANGGAAIYQAEEGTTTLTGNIFYGNVGKSDNGNQSSATDKAGGNTSGIVTSKGYNIYDCASPGFTTSGTGDTEISAPPISTLSFKPIADSTATKKLPTELPPGYPTVDFFGNNIPVSGAVGAVQEPVVYKLYCDSIGRGRVSIKIKSEDDKPLPLPADSLFDSGTNLTLKADVDSTTAWRFRHWEVDGQKLSTLDSLNITMNAHTKVRAVFGYIIQVTAIMEDRTSGKVSLSHAIDSVNKTPDVSNFIITFDATVTNDTIKLSSTLPDIKKTLTIDGGGEHSGVTLSGNNACRIMSIGDNSNSPEVTLRRLHFRNGKDDNGGAIYKNNGILNLQSCIFSDNRATGTSQGQGGGAIYNAAGALNVQGCTFYKDSAAAGSGGVIYNTGTTTLTGNIFYGNGAEYDNIIFNYSSGKATSGGYNVYDSNTTVLNASGDTKAASQPIQPGSFEPITGVATGKLPASPPPGYPDTDFYGKSISGGGAAGAVQQPVAPGSTVTSVTISPANPNVPKGNFLQFEAKVEPFPSASQEVTWKVADGIQGTSITNTGYLTVAAGESTGTKLTVTATSNVDNITYGTTAVTVAEASSITSVKVTPSSSSVLKGGTVQFTAVVTTSPATGIDKKVTWSIFSGAQSSGTTMNGDGLLSIGIDESSNNVTVRATSIIPPYVYGDATITVGTGSSGTSTLTISQKDVTVQRGQTHQFSGTPGGNFTGGVQWSLSGRKGTGATTTTISSTISESGLLTVSSNETCDTLFVRLSSTSIPGLYDIAKVTVTSDAVAPVVDDVRITPSSVFVQKGQSQLFKATVDVQGGAGLGVVWSVSGGTPGAGTNISQGGLLTVSATETASSLIVRATSAGSAAKYGEATVALSDMPVPPAVLGVTVIPTAVDVQKGTTQTFFTDVAVQGAADQSVNWTVRGSSLYLSESTNITQAGLLSVHGGEGAETLTVRATSRFDESKYGEATVTRTNVAVEPAVLNIIVTPTAASVQKGQFLSFSPTVVVQGDPNKDLEWSIIGNTNPATKVSAGQLFVATDETATTLTVRASSKAYPLKYGQVTVTVAETSKVTGLFVTPTAARVARGGKLQLKAEVHAEGGASEDVSWSVIGGTAAGTNISATGLLTLAVNETATTLTVRAASVADPTNYYREVVITSAPVGLAEVPASGLQLYPSPFADRLSLAGAAGATLQVFTASGAIVHSQQVTGANEIIPLEHLPAGLYFFRVEKDGKQETLKATKIR
jgi:hypothetical protein